MDAVWVGVICLVAVVLFVRNAMPPDIVAVLVLGALVITRLVSPAEAIAGFANPATVAVAALLVLSAGLRETGALGALARGLAHIGRIGPVLQLALVVTVSAVSAFINNTAAVAVFLPMVLSVARRRGIPASKLLIPLSYASQFGGTCTLIGTSTNLLVNSLIVGAGLKAFGLFEFAPLGVLLSAVGALYLCTVGWWLLPKRASPALAADAYAIRDYLFWLSVGADSRLAGRRVDQAGLAAGGGLSLLEVLRGDERLRPGPREPLLAGDRLLVQGEAEPVLDFARRHGLDLDPLAGDAPSALEGDGLQLVEVLVAPNSPAIGHAWAANDAPWAARSAPLAIARRDSVLHTGLGATVLRAGDTMLLLVAAADMPMLRDDTALIVLSERDNPSERRRRAPLAIAIVVTVVLVASLGWLPIEIAGLLGAAAMVLGRCIGAERVYRHLDLRVLVLLAAMLPLGVAIQRSGAAAALVSGALQLMPSGNPMLALAVVYAATALITEVITNNATAVLMTPIALALAAQLGLSPLPFVVAVMFAASTSFSTPIGYQTNTMVFGAGGYTFTDFLRVGLPLNLLFWAVSVTCIPRLFPFLPAG
jgi:di/tricarboxylate transporter